MRQKVAIMGSGALASIIGEKLAQSDLKEYYELIGVYSLNYAHASRLAAKCGCTPYQSMDELLEKRPDYVIEAATSQAVKAYGTHILEKGSNIILISTGALAEKEFYEKMSQTAKENQKKIHLVSGAIGGLDLMLSMKEMGNMASKISSSKSPASLNGAPGLKGREIPESEPMCLFSGTAKEAIKGFPKNVNVAVSTALTTNGTEHTQVEIHSVPGKKTNEHEIVLENNLVKARVNILCQPDSRNTKSSVLTAYSALALLRNLASPVCFF